MCHKFNRRWSFFFGLHIPYNRSAGYEKTMGKMLVYKFFTLK